jgi:phage terminase large subunit GpA-like protein
MDRQCNNCGESNWTKVHDEQYPERRQRDGDKTEKHVYECENCGKEGRKFVDGETGGVQYTGYAR